MISQFGILKREAASDWSTCIWDRYQGNLDDPVWEENKHNITHSVRIKVIGCWDTVGSLGIPETRYTKFVTKLFRLNREHAFHDVILPDGTPLPHLFVSLIIPASSGRARFPCSSLGRGS